MISLIMCCRIKGNKNSNLTDSLESFIKNASSKDNFEVLIKFDDDDEQVASVISKLEQMPVNLKYIITPRGRGYVDLHKGYKDLYKLINNKTKFIWVITDDMTVTSPNWDRLILSKYSEKLPICTIRTRKLTRLHKLTYHRAFHKLDSFPIWSRMWLDVAGFGPIFATDAWTNIIDYTLFKKHNIDNRILLNELTYKRRIDQTIDGTNTDRWKNETSEIINYVNSDEGKAEALATAAKLAEQIRKTGKRKINSFYDIRQQIGRLFIDKDNL